MYSCASPPSRCRGEVCWGMAPARRPGSLWVRWAVWVPSDGGGFVCPICGEKGRKGGRSGAGGRPEQRHSHSMSSQAGPPWSLASPWDPQHGSKLLGSELEMLGRWELGQGKRKCSPPKACSVMLRHRDSRVGLISRSGPGTGQSAWERREWWW